jgi:carboxyl-terminal processing protease
MKTYLLVGLVVLALARPCAAQDTPKPTYPELFEAVWQTINDNFYDPNFGGVDWKAMRRKYQPEVAKVTDDNSFTALAYRMMRELHVSHLELVPRQLVQSGIAVRSKRIEGKSIITTVAIASDAQRRGLRVGDLLMSSPAELVGQIGTPATVRVQGCDGRERSLQVRRENPWWPPEHPSLRWRSVEQASGHRIGYIKIPRFDDDAAPLIDAAMAALKGTYGLIIDLRDESGGNLSSLRLVSYLIPGPRMTVALLSRPFLERLGGAPEQVDLSKVPRVSGAYTTAAIIEAMKKNNGGAAFYTEDVGDRLYRGRVVVLINAGTGSASEGFAAMVKGQKSVTLVGHTTLGALLGGERFDLPGGWVLTVPTHASWGPDGKRYIDQAVTPDVEVTWTKQDLCEGRDPDMAKALDLLGNGE